MPRDYRPKDRLINQWVTKLRMQNGRSPFTCEGYARDVEQFARFLGDFAALPNADNEQVNAFIVELVGCGSYSRVTIRRKLVAIRVFFTYLRREKLRPDNPTLDVTSPPPEKRLPIVMNEQEVTRLLGAQITHVGTSNRTRTDFQQARDSAIMELLYASGLRRMEIARLNLEDVKIEERTLRVFGKGNKERIVVFNGSAVDAMQAYLHVRLRTSDKAFFIGRSGKRLQPRQIWAIFRAFADRSEIGTHATPHVMRHSFATHLLDNNVNLTVIQALLGHASLATTGIYTNVSREDVRKAYDRGHPRDRNKAQQESEGAA